MAKLCNDRSVRFAPFLLPSNAPNSLAIHKLCLALLILQLSLSLSQVFHNSSLLLALHPSAFHYETSRLVVFVSLFVNLSWSLSVISAIFGMARNNAALILPNLSLSFLLLPFQMVTLLVLILSSSFALSIANSLGCAFVLAVSIPIEWILLRRIRRKALAEEIWQ
ncbi:hypothetical protein niasHS_002630 [Heterodera schachtii]|uniref:Uncharacterized protein n=1 Tax=Heterodera schachtii TaxID=97005 RepID=A0ABD2K204_HETSC